MRCYLSLRKDNAIETGLALYLLPSLRLGDRLRRVSIRLRAQSSWAEISRRALARFCVVTRSTDVRKLWTSPDASRRRPRRWTVTACL